MNFEMIPWVEATRKAGKKIQNKIKSEYRCNFQWPTLDCISKNFTTFLFIRLTVAFLPNGKVHLNENVRCSRFSNALYSKLQLTFRSDARRKLLLLFSSMFFIFSSFVALLCYKTQPPLSFGFWYFFPQSFSIFSVYLTM